MRTKLVNPETDKENNYYGNDKDDGGNGVIQESIDPNKKDTPVD